eukprot:TRINITY_DN178583_c0_g1_i1.p1 TRINITY_DN178583_c0_g1~~TRINITY_DN178583_c0_g1_i1.p1  ORF type:complete len:137 (-),score=3.37 TRINITY_DN178583_c0_g1_i1:200-568(-)
MVWHQWWPYDPEPNSPALEPYAVNVQERKVYWWCACGNSQNQPWCDGAHKGTAFKPVQYIPERTGQLWMCGCKHANDTLNGRPLCTYACVSVKCNKYTPQACVTAFAVCFSVGIISTYVFHP